VSVEKRGGEYSSHPDECKQMITPDRLVAVSATVCQQDNLCHEGIVIPDMNPMLRFVLMAVGTLLLVVLAICS
jgi:hypothetical protein